MQMNGIPRPPLLHSFDSTQDSFFDVPNRMEGGAKMKKLKSVKSRFEIQRALLRIPKFAIPSTQSYSASRKRTTALNVAPNRLLTEF